VRVARTARRLRRDVIKTGGGEIGVKMGRRPKLTDHQKREAIKRRDAGEPMRENCAHVQCLAQHNFETYAWSVRCPWREGVNA
jgi:hypothetical protein